GDEVPVGRLRPARVPRVPADVATRRRARLLALADGRLAGVAAHRAVPREAEGVALPDAVRHPEDRRARGLVEGRVRVAAAGADDAGVGQAERAGAEGDVGVPGDVARVRGAAAAAGVGGAVERPDRGGADIEAIPAGGGRGEGDVVLRVAARVAGREDP